MFPVVVILELTINVLKWVVGRLEYFCSGDTATDVLRRVLEQLEGFRHRLLHGRRDRRLRVSKCE